ncbi:MAG: Arc family DNA-binding protein [Bryobacteraceae bacterium]
MAERKPFLLRIDSDVLEQVRVWAEDELRSLNGQVEYILREALKRRGRAEPSPPAEREEPS